MQKNHPLYFIIVIKNTVSYALCKKIQKIFYNRYSGMAEEGGRQTVTDKYGRKKILKTQRIAAKPLKKQAAIKSKLYARLLLFSMF